MDVEKKILELALRGYTLLFDIHVGESNWYAFSSDKYAKQSVPGWAMFFETVSSTKEEAIEKLEKFIKKYVFIENIDEDEF